MLWQEKRKKKNSSGVTVATFQKFAVLLIQSAMCMYSAGYTTWMWQNYWLDCRFFCHVAAFCAWQAKARCTFRFQARGATRKCFRPNIFQCADYVFYHPHLFISKSMRLTPVCVYIGLELCWIAGSTSSEHWYYNILFDCERHRYFGRDICRVAFHKRSS